MPQPFKTELENRGPNCCFQLKDQDGKLVTQLWTKEPYEANHINDAFAKFAELAHIPLEKAEALYVHRFPPDGP